MTEDGMRDWIDNVDYEILLRRWRFAKSGDKFFQGEIGEYYDNIMREKGLKLSSADRVRINKLVGWG